MVGFVCWGDVPNGLAWRGIALLIGAGLWMLRQEQVRARLAVRRRSLSGQPLSRAARPRRRSDQGLACLGDHPAGVGRQRRVGTKRDDFGQFVGMQRLQP